MANKLTPFTTAEGQHGFINLSDGKVYADNQGVRLLTRMESADDESNELLVDYADEYSQRLRGEQLIRANDTEGRLIKMDLSPSDVHTPSAMPNYAAGYKLADGVADVVCPVIVVAKAIDKYNTWNSDDAFQLPGETETTPGGSVTEISPRLSQDSYQTVERALGSFVTTQMVANADAPLKPAQAALRRVLRAMMLSREVRVATKYRDTSTYDSTLVNDLTTDATKKWNEGANSNPILDLQSMMEKSYAPITRFIMSEQTRNDLSRNKAMLQYYANKMGLKAIPTLEEIRTQFGLPPFTVAPMKYKATASGLTYVWANDVIGVVEPDQNPPTDQESVASGYTFRWNGGDTPDGAAQNGMLVRQFFDKRRGARGGTMVIVVHQDAEQRTSTLVGGIIKGAHQ